MISKEKLANYLIWIQIYYNMIIRFFIEDLNFSSSLSYFSDILTIILFILWISDKFPIINFNKKAKKIYVLIMIFILLSIATSIINHVKIPLYIWGFRNTCRFFIWFICCIRFIRLDFLWKNFKICEYIIFINFIYMIIQYLLLGIKSDYLNGFFGTYTGGNAAVNTFIIVMTVLSIMFYYFYHKIKKKEFGLLIFVMILTCTLNELKIYYIEIIIIFIISFLLLYKSKKIQIIKIFKNVALITVLVLVSLNIFSVIYPNFSNFFTVESILDYSTRSYNSNEIMYINNVPVMNRMSQFEIVHQYLLKSNTERLFGIGMGNAETSKFSFLVSDFYRHYGGTNYMGYSISVIMIENGLMGLLIYTSFFLMEIYTCFKRFLIETDPFSKGFNYCGVTLGALAILLCVYNSSLRIESSGYIYFTFLAIPYIGKASFRNFK